LLGPEYWFPEIRSRGGVILVMTLTLYPYVYLLARNAFLTQGRRALEVAQSLGDNRWRGFFRLALPMARPWIAGGVTLALMETLADFGAVSIFNYDTFATTIYKAWFGLFSISAASQLASLLILFVFILLLMEQYATSRTRYTQTERSGSSGDRIILSPIKRGFAFAFCLLVLSVAFLLPITQLFFWSRNILYSDLNSHYFDLLGHSLFLASTAAVITVGTVLILVYTNRRHNTLIVHIMIRVATLGYALPGSVLAVGVFIPLAWLDTQLIQLFALDLFLQGTLLAMFSAYLVRFLAVAHHPIQSAIQRISPNIDESAKNLGCKGWTMLKQIHLPIMQGGLMTAVVLVFVDVMKEMPITLMTRPFGWDTLSIRIYEMTSEGEWERAALPAVALVLAGLIPVIMLTRNRSWESSRETKP
jgi:iron(III) transport system permease protein